VLFQTLPKYATLSLSNFLMYHTSVAELITSSSGEQLQPTSNKEIAAKFRSLLWSIFQITVMFSILESSSYQPFPKRENQSVLDLFYWGNLCNNYILACK